MHFAHSFTAKFGSRKQYRKIICAWLGFNIFDCAEKEWDRKNEWLSKWLGENYQSPITSLIVNWHDEEIISLILIEQPAFHAGEHITLWLVRTKHHAYVWTFLEGKPYQEVKKQMSVELYDRIYSQMITWQQAKPLKPENMPKGAIPGYIGILSLYGRGESKQILLNTEDFFICETKSCDNFKLGRLSAVLEDMIQLF